MGVVRKWAPEEDAALRFHYPLHGMYWPGWREVLPGRSVDAVYSRAAKLGLRRSSRGRKRKPGTAEPERPRTCGCCRFFRAGGCRGKCAERHARGMFGEAPEVRPEYDASLCEWGVAC